jgi:type II secretion system protein G
MKVEQKRGFTLIELLVVIAIIGLLASIVLASLNSARKKSRDARRLADLKQLQNALELYANDNSGNYPSNATTVGAGGQTAATGLAALVTGAFIAAIPADPLGGTVIYLYKTIPAANNANNATGYCIAAKIEGTAPTPSSTCQASATLLVSGDTDTSGTTVAPTYEVGN